MDDEARLAGPGRPPHTPTPRPLRKDRPSRKPLASQQSSIGLVCGMPFCSSEMLRPSCLRCSAKLSGKPAAHQCANTSECLISVRGLVSTKHRNGDDGPNIRGLFFVYIIVSIPSVVSLLN